MQTLPIELRPRTLTGSGIAKKIRRAGLIPANVYGNGIENRSVAADPKPLAKALGTAFGRNQLLELSITGEDTKFLAIAKEIQIHPLTRRLRHADLMVVQPDTKISVLLPIRLDGKSEGEKVGGRINFTVRFVRATCTPATLPTDVKVNMGPLQIGDTVMVGDIIFPEGVTPVYKKKFKVLDILVPKGGGDEEAVEGAAAAAPVA